MKPRKKKEVNVTYLSLLSLLSFIAQSIIPGSKDGGINLIPPFYSRVILYHPQFNLEKTSILTGRKDLIINNNQVIISTLKREFLTANN